MTIVAPGSGSPVGDPFEGPTASVDDRGTSLWRGAWQRLRRDPFAIAGALIVLVFVVVAIAAPLIAPYEPGRAQWGNQVTPSSVPGPSDGHLLGLDAFGSCLLYISPSPRD